MGVWILIPLGSFKNPCTVSQGQDRQTVLWFLVFLTDAENCPHDFDNFFQLFGSDPFLYPDKQLVHLKHPNLAFRIAPEENDQ